MPRKRSPEPPPPGTFEIPNWDEASLQRVKAALLLFGTTISDTRRMFGANEHQVDPVKHLVGSAMLWGGNPEKDALYLPITPARNDGSTTYKLTVRDIPVDGFWSLTVYNGEGYFQPNPTNAYAVNSITAKQAPDGSVTIQLGGCGGNMANCLPIAQGWNYTVRLFQPPRNPQWHLEIPRGPACELSPWRRRQFKEESAVYPRPVRHARCEGSFGSSASHRSATRRSRNVRYASNTERIDASQQNVARCHKET